MHKIRVFLPKGTPSCCLTFSATTVSSSITRALGRGCPKQSKGLLGQHQPKQPPGRTHPTAHLGYQQTGICTNTAECEVTHCNSGILQTPLPWESQQTIRVRVLVKFRG